MVRGALPCLLLEDDLMHYGHLSLAMALFILMAAGICQAQPAAELPQGVKAVWDLSQAFRETTPTRERICLNGLWRWQPAKDAADAVPAGDWGYFKAPGCWPGITDYMQKDCQTVYPHPSWKGVDLRGLSSAWYQREITIPKDWAGRRITVQADYLNSYAAVYLDGKKAGEMRFPGGDLEITSACRPGEKHVLSMLVVALPLKGVMMSYGDTNAARQMKGSVARRGLCGDVYLTGAFLPRFTDVRVDTSVRKGEITFSVGLQNVPREMEFSLEAKILDGTKTVGEFSSGFVSAQSVVDGRFTFGGKWKPDKLWDIHTPQNTYVLKLEMSTRNGGPVDAAFPVRFGFRELWIDGRDFYLNGSRIFL
jgi:beta-galactosidase/beta-glucuronidase